MELKGIWSEEDFAVGYVYLRNVSSNKSPEIHRQIPLLGLFDVTLNAENGMWWSWRGFCFSLLATRTS